MRRAFALPALIVLFVAVALPALVRAEDAPAKGNAQAEARAAETARIQKAVDELIPVVSKLRGLEWKKPVPAAVLSREELRAYMLSELDKETTPEEWAADTRILKRLGLLGPKEDLKDMVLSMFQAAVAGFYNPETGEMYVIEGMDVDGQKPTIVHELCHALEDQHFDLEAMEKPYRENDPDRQFAIRCLWEGSAEWMRRTYQDQEPEVAAHHYAAQGKNPSAAAQQAMMQTTPTYMLLTTLLHYRMGPNFIGHQLTKYGYVDGMQRMFDDPPMSQEHLLHPHKWLGPVRDYPRQIVWGGDVAAAFGEGWTKLDEHSVGEIDLALYLDYFLGDEGGRLNMRDMGFGRFVDQRSNTAARGWDGGRVQFIEHTDGRMAFVQAFAFDSEQDAEEAGRLLGEATRKAAGDTWKGDGWQRDEAATALHMSYDFHTAHGHGRILVRGQSVLVLDGAPDSCFEKAWPVVEKISFTAHEKDQGDNAPDPFAGDVVVDARRGLGLRTPEGWSARAGGRMPISFATATKAGVSVEFLVLDQEVSRAGLPQIAQMFLGGGFSAAKATPTRIMGFDGIQHPLPVPAGMHGVIHFAADLARTYAVTVVGPADAVAATSADVQRLLSGRPTADTDEPVSAATDAKPGVGLRSIPGY
ncbi:MAG: hypothetical protein O2894_10640 [Planctomycetota bacterium]|nr:hypothetical protein [Planctomycetota bacterium]